MSRKHKHSTNKGAKTKAHTKSKEETQKQVGKRTRMEIAVYVVGAFATICTVITGVMFARSHNTAGIWLLFITLTLSSLALCLWLQDRVGKEPVPPPTSPTVILHNQGRIAKPVAIDNRIYVDVTPEYLLNFFKEHTQAMAMRLLEAYRGKWLKTSGTVRNVIVCPAYTQVIIAASPTMLIQQVSGIFKDAAERERVATLRKGQMITLCGVIDRSNEITLTLESCFLS